MSLEDWMPEARQLSAQCWCDKETSHIEMNPALAESVARRIASWMDSAAQFSRNESYYRGLLIRCGEAIGESAYICDDGSRSEDVLCAKIPEIVEKFMKPKNPEWSKATHSILWMHPDAPSFEEQIRNDQIMRNERLGEIAYNSYCASRGWKSVRGEPLPKWEQQDATLRTAWCDAADAVHATVSNTKPEMDGGIKNTH